MTNVLSHAPPDRDATEERTGAALVFLAAVGPMLTVTSLRHLMIDMHGFGPAAVHAFVGVGMLGAFIGAPIIAAGADARASHLRRATMLAAGDAIVTVATVIVSHAWMLFALRALHGALSMSVLALLLGRFRGSRRELVMHAGPALVLALAVGPAVGGIISQHGGPTSAFGVAAACSVCLASLLATYGDTPRSAPANDRPKWPLALARKSLAPLAVLGAQRLALGGLVGILAARAASANDVSVGAGLSALLIAFAMTAYAVGRRQPTPRSSSALVVLGAVIFAAAFFGLAFVEGAPTLFTLAFAGIGAGLAYAPSLERVAGLASESERASAMALVHAAGAAGMIVGPFVAAFIDVTLHGFAPSARASVFLVLAAFIQLAAASAARPHFSERSA